MTERGAGTAPPAVPPIRHHDDLRAVITHFCGQEQHAIQRQLNADRFRLTSVLTTLTILIGALLQLTRFDQLANLVALAAFLLLVYLEFVFRYRSNACRLIIFHIQAQRVAALAQYNYHTPSQEADAPEVRYENNEALYRGALRKFWTCARVDEITYLVWLAGIALLLVLQVLRDSVFRACIARATPGEPTDCLGAVWSAWSAGARMWLGAGTPACLPGGL